MYASTREAIILVHFIKLIDNTLNEKGKKQQ